MSFTTLPSNASLKPKSFKAHVSDDQLKSLHQLIDLSPIGPDTYEGRVTDPKDFTSFGIKRQWLVDSKTRWQKYDWRKAEERINALPNFHVEIEDQGFKFDVHFAALFSKKSDAVPLLLLHGWPGSFLEFLGVLEVLSSKYDENSLPFHVIVPSLPGYCYSNGPPLDRDFTVQDIAKIMDKLMLGLGLNAYVAQGGDIGSFVTRVLAVTSSACKAAHINLCIGVFPESEEEENKLDAKGQKAVGRATDFATLGAAYAREHGTRPSTIGLVLSSSPIALLAWIGEKFLQWTDQSPPTDEILDSITLWWLTQSFPRAIYPYRQFFGAKPTFFHNDTENWYIKKPLGYSWHPQELAPVPVSLVAKTGNLVWHREHDKGGHFMAMEGPEDFVKDIEDFVGEVWSRAKDA